MALSKMNYQFKKCFVFIGLLTFAMLFSKSALAQADTRPSLAELEQRQGWFDLALMSVLVMDACELNMPLGETDRVAAMMALYARSVDDYAYDNRTKYVTANILGQKSKLGVGKFCSWMPEILNASWGRQFFPDYAIGDDFK